mgnify:CR=1 FL=1
MRRCNHNIRKTLNLVDEMIRVADKGDIEREDNGCGILYGVLRDSAYKVKKLAEQEMSDAEYLRLKAENPEAEITANSDNVY